MLNSLACFTIALAAVQAAPLVENDGFTQSVIQQAYNRVDPSVCVLSYTIEITNPGSGEVSRRANNALGLIVSSDGLVMTHGHMILENRVPFGIKVSVGEGDSQREYDAKALRKPDDVNVCFLRITNPDGVKFPYVRFSNPGRLQVGEPILSIGILSETLDFARAIQMRRVGAVLEQPRLTYALDQPVAFGYVGGPAIDTAGRVIGVVGFDLSSQEGGDLYARSGHPLLFQAPLFQKLIDTPPTDSQSADAGDPDDAYLGVFTQPLTDDLAEYWKLPKMGGVVVSTVIPGSPADAAGFRSGDVIVEFNGTPVRAKQDQEVVGFTKLVRESPLGAPLPIRLYRDAQPMEISLTLTTRPKSAADADELEDEVFGLTIRELTQDIRIMLNLPQAVDGVVVRRVKSGSPGQLAGLRPGFIIRKLGDHDVTDLDSFSAAVKALTEARPDEVTVFCQLGPNTAFFRLQPRWSPLPPTESAPLNDK